MIKYVPAAFLLAAFLLAASLLAGPLAAHEHETGHLPPPDTAGHHHEMMNGIPSNAISRATRATEPGQGAFAAIQEIVSILETDPKTDWSKVDIDALRRHLVDMSNVTLYAVASPAPSDDGVRYDVTGTGPVRESIRRMVVAHADTMNGVNGWTMIAGETPDGATITVTPADRADLAKLRGLGFFGLMAIGMHHQDHHLAIASGKAPHQ